MSAHNRKLLSLPCLSREDTQKRKNQKLFYFEHQWWRKMQNPEKNTESFLQTVKRTIITTTIIALVLYLINIFPSGESSKLKVFGIIWLVIFSIVFGGHLLELVFINHIKFSLPRNILLLYFIRIGYWFLSSIPLFILANFVSNLFSHKRGHLGNWWTFGFIYIGIQLLMYGIMHIRLKKSFYNGVY